jgi:arylsulfatase A-like enzyme
MVLVGLVCGATSALAAAASTAGFPAASTAGIDLLRQAPLTMSVLRAGIEPGSRLAKPGLGAEWEPLADAASARSFARRSRVDLAAPLKGAAELLVSCAVPDADPAGVRTSVLLNGRRLGIIRLTAEARVARFPLKPRMVRPGRNRVELKKASGDAAAGTGALVCQFLVLREAVGQGVPYTPPIRESAGHLVLTAGAQFEVFLRHGATGQLAVEVCRGTGRLVVEGAGGPVHDGTLASGSPQVLRMKWPHSGFGLARLEAGPEGAVICRLDWQTDGGSPRTVDPVLQRPDDEPRNVLLIVIDTLRADRLGIYGSGRDLTPAMDALGAQGIVFENVVAQSAWTSPATASILTGTDPTTHGVRRLGDTIDTAVPALAEVLGANGYATAAITTNINVRAELGFDRGFASYRYLPESEAREGFYAQAAEVEAEAMAWLDAQAGRPFFLYLHLSEPHAPYAPSPQAARRFVRGQPSDEIRTAPDPMEHLSESLVAGRGADLAWVRSLYDAEVATVDAMLARLRENLRARGLWANTLVVLTSDHGEAFGEHGVAGHGHTVFAEEVQVPLIFHWDGASAQRSPALARQIDVLPTTLDLLGIAAPSAVEGVSLLGETAGEAFTETRLHRVEKTGLVLGGFKVILTQGRSSGSQIAVHDLREDPEELNDVAGERPFLAGWAAQEFRRRESEAPATPRVRNDPAIEKRLKMLGYLD